MWDGAAGVLRCFLEAAAVKLGLQVWEEARERFQAEGEHMPSGTNRVPWA